MAEKARRVATWILITFTLHSCGKDSIGESQNGDATGYLLKNIYRSVKAPPGDCILQLIIDNFGETFNAKGEQTRRCPLNMDAAQIRHTCGLEPTGGVSLDDLQQIERNLVWGSSKTARGKTRAGAIERKVYFCVFDSRMSLLRLPEYKKYEHHHPHICDVILSNRHAHSFRNNSHGSMFRQLALSYYEACIRVKNRDFTERTWEDNEEGEERDDTYYVEAWELFRMFQHLQPDTHAIQDALNEYFGENVTEEVVCYRPSGNGRAWAPKAMVPSLVCCRFGGKKGDEDLMIITARGQITKCNALKTNPQI